MCAASCRATSRRARIFLNSPHNPTGGVATLEDLKGIAELVRGKDVAVFSDEPYDRMVWRGRHHSLLEVPGMLEQTVAAYTFSKSFSMSGWRLGFCGQQPRNHRRASASSPTARISCVPPFTQMAGVVAMREELGYRDAKMKEFQKKVELLVAGMNKIDGVSCVDARRHVLRLSVGGGDLQPPRHHLAWPRAVSCLRAPTTCGAWRAWAASASARPARGFLRLSCAQPDERIAEAFAFMAEAFKRKDRVDAYLSAHPEFRLQRAIRRDRRRTVLKDLAGLKASTTSIWLA